MTGQADWEIDCSLSLHSFCGKEYLCFLLLGINPFEMPTEINHIFCFWVLFLFAFIWKNILYFTRVLHTLQYGMAAKWRLIAFLLRCRQCRTLVLTCLKTRTHVPLRCCPRCVYFSPLSMSMFIWSAQRTPPSAHVLCPCHTWVLSLITWICSKLFHYFILLPRR